MAEDTARARGAGKARCFSEIPRIEGGRLVLKRLVPSDAPALAELTGDPAVYRYEPTFLLERQYADARQAIGALYRDFPSESIVLGVFLRDCGVADGGFCGLAELYGYRREIRKVSVGYRLLRRRWGQGIATEALSLLIGYLYGRTDAEIVTASTMVENRASARVLEKNGFTLVAHAVGEDWGYPDPTPADKWIR